MRWTQDRRSRPALALDVGNLFARSESEGLACSPVLFELQVMIDHINTGSDGSLKFRISRDVH